MEILRDRLPGRNFQGVEYDTNFKIIEAVLRCETMVVRLSTKWTTERKRKINYNQVWTKPICEYLTRD